MALEWEKHLRLEKSTIQDPDAMKRSSWLKDGIGKVMSAMKCSLDPMILGGSHYPIPNSAGTPCTIDGGYRLADKN